MVIGSGTANAVGPQMYLATIGLLVLPITEETGFSHTTITSAYSVAAVGIAISLVIMARFVDRYTARYLLVPGYVGFAASMALVGLVPPITPVYLIPYFFVGFFGAGTAVPATRAVVSWFDNNRALTIGIVTGIIGLGMAPGPDAGRCTHRQRRMAAGLQRHDADHRRGAGPDSHPVRAGPARNATSENGSSTTRERRGRDVSLELPSLTYHEAVRTQQL